MMRLLPLAACLALAALPLAALTAQQETPVAPPVAEAAARLLAMVLGLSLLGYAVNVFIFAMGRLWQDAAPILAQGARVADPLPQALVLTAIVIGFAMTALFLVVLLASRGISGTDHVDGSHSRDVQEMP